MLLMCLEECDYFWPFLAVDRYCAEITHSAAGFTVCSHGTAQAVQSPATLPLTSIPGSITTGNRECNSK